MAAFWLGFCTEEDRRCEDVLKAQCHPAVTAAILEKAYEVEPLSGAIEMDGSALLLEGERSHPDGK